MHVHKRAATSLALLSMMIAGCATDPGPVATDPPPHMFAGAFTHRNLWANADDFGPVPASRQAQGDAVCADAGFKTARGYHPHALDKDDLPYRDGGFLCGT